RITHFSNCKYICEDFLAAVDNFEYIYLTMEVISPKHRLLKFKKEVLDELKIDFKKIKPFDRHLSEAESEEKLNKIIVWLSSTPKNIVYRVNTILNRQQVVHHHIVEALKKYTRPIPVISTFPCVEELIIVNGWDKSVELNLERQQYEVIVDAACGAAVLRGAHIYAPGVLGMPRGLKVGDIVSVYADLEQACKKGLVTEYDKKNKLFVGNGIVQLTREQIFGHETEHTSGIAVTMTDIISHIPQINDNILPKGYVLLQNLPSILCSRVLDPQPGETVLDMCAAPGNKTTHIAALMENKGVVVAIEKIKNKLERLNSNIENFSATIVKAYCFDSTKAVCDAEEKSIFDGPPYSKESFDRVLLDGPCSALGQRPQIRNPISVSQLRSYVPLQRKLFTSAVQLLRPGGTLVYSTCTITIAENEGIIAWALKTFPNLELRSVREILMSMKMEKFATVGYTIDGLTTEQSDKLCRFDENDTVGFFIACFIKR
ncbi:hypothetical protein TSAR_002126, partial [Trichomalopsis sarcophagae]